MLTIIKCDQWVLAMIIVFPLAYHTKLAVALLMLPKNDTEHFFIWKGLAKRQASDNKKYEVLHKDNKAHVVKINDCPRAGETQYGYVFFKKSARTPGPVEHVDKVNIYNAPENNSYNRIIFSEVESNQ